MRTRLPRLPRAADIGPDPEPAIDRFEGLLGGPGTLESEHVRPAICPLEAAFGRSVPCHGMLCDLFDSPAGPGCAVTRWCPEARHDRRKAAWFIARRTARPDAPRFRSRKEQHA